jgi:hypothetical protein
MGKVSRMRFNKFKGVNQLQKPVVLNVAGEIGQVMASVSRDGEELQELISKTLHAERPVTLDFIDIDQVTASFLNAVIGTLYHKFDAAFLERYLKFVNLTPAGETLLRSVQEMTGNFAKNQAV